MEKENIRKENLFKAWDDFFLADYKRVSIIKFDEIFEDIATVEGSSEKFLDLDLGGGRKARGIAITPDIAANTRNGDIMLLTLGRKERTWYALELMSIASQLTQTDGKVHMSFNGSMLQNGSFEKMVEH